MHQAEEGTEIRGERRFLFGGFELLPASGELFRGGERVPLQHQPAELLTLLVRRAGRVVSREEIREAIWGAGAYVDADQGINFCVRQIRQALDDDASEPRFVETVPRHGYRFVAPVTEAEGPLGPDRGAVEATAAAEAAPPAPGPARKLPARRLVPLAAALLVAAVLAGALILGNGGDREPGAAPPAAQAPRRPLVVPEEAHSRFLEARYLVERAEGEDLATAPARAVELLEAVVEEVPEHAEAHAVLSEAWMMRLDLPRPEAMERAEEAARRALELDPYLPQAHAVLAAALLFHRLDWAGAERHVERALELAPDHPDAVFVRALLQSAVGRHDQAIAGARRAARLEPGRLPGISLAWFHFFARRFDQAIEEAERILSLRPTDEPSHNVLVYSHLLRGDEAAATRENDRYYHLVWGYPEEVELGLPGARQLFREWWVNRDRGEGEWLLSPTLLATYATFSSDREGATAHLLQACEERTASWDLPFLVQDPRWDPLRREPAFEEVVQCVGAPGTTLEIPGLPGPEE